MPTQEFELQTIAGPVKGVAPEGVMVPSPYSWLLANNIPPLSRRGDLFLDLGTGTGVIAIVATKMGGKSIWVTDNNPEALEATRYNARLNGVEDQIRILPAGNMFEPVGDTKFDGIFCNPAQLPMPTQSDQPSAYSAGERGRKMVEELIYDGGRNHLRSGGGLLFTHTSLVNLYETYKSFWDTGFVCEIRAETEIPFRDFYDNNWIERTYQAWVDDANKKFRSLPLLTLQERLYLEQEGIFRRGEDGTYLERVLVLHAARIEYDIGQDADGYPAMVEKPNFLHPNQ